MLGSVILIDSSSTIFGILIWPGPTDNANQRNINHFQFLDFWMKKKGYTFFPLKEYLCVLNSPGFSSDMWIQGPNKYSLQEPYLPELHLRPWNSGHCVVWRHKEASIYLR